MPNREFKAGAVEWFDLTVDDADGVRAFYEAVVGWKSDAHDMGEYADFNMRRPDEDGRTVTGICHARGANADIPPGWLIYVNTMDVDAAAGKCAKLGGKVLAGPRNMGGRRFCVIEDPAGARCALIGPP